MISTSIQRSEIIATTRTQTSSSPLYSTSPSIDSNANVELLTEDQVQDYAKSVGVTINLTTLGPGYRAVARAIHDEEQIIGYCEGFVLPTGQILHVDKLEVWKKALDRAKSENPEGFKNGGQVFGVSLLLGYMSVLHGKKSGCGKAEFLAIDDEAFQHKRLVRFFSRAGFNRIRYVGDDIANIPDRLVWGGCGTLMNQTIDNLLILWSKILSKNKF